jgi:hypothetical protein
LTTRPEKQCRAVKRSTIPLDYADDKMRGVIFGDRANKLGCWPWNIDGTLEKAAEFLSAFGGSPAQAYPEIVSLEIAADESFGENDEFGSFLGGIR